MYSDSIIVGDDDSITLLGAETQSEVRSIIKDIVDIIYAMTIKWKAC